MEEVTLDNALDCIEAISQSAKREIMDCDPQDRTYVLGMLSAALANAALEVKTLNEKLSTQGEATPMTADQKLTVQMLLRRALKRDES